MMCFNTLKAVLFHYVLYDCCVYCPSLCIHVEIACITAYQHWFRWRASQTNSAIYHSCELDHNRYVAIFTTKSINQPINILSSVSLNWWLLLSPQSEKSCWYDSRFLFYWSNSHSVLFNSIHLVKLSFNNQTLTHVFLFCIPFYSQLIWRYNGNTL